MGELYFSFFLTTHLGNHLSGNTPADSALLPAGNPSNLRGFLLDQVSHCARFYQLVDILVIVMSAEHQYLYRSLTLLELKEEMKNQRY